MNSASFIARLMFWSSLHTILKLSMLILMSSSAEVRSISDGDGDGSRTPLKMEMETGGPKPLAKV